MAFKFVFSDKFRARNTLKKFLNVFLRIFLRILRTAKNYNVKCYVTISKKRLQRAKLFGRQPVKKPSASVKNRKARIKLGK